jgi:hypothetical protein
MDAAPSSVPLLVLILVADFALTSFHAYQEWKSPGAPLWRNFGAIVGLKFSDRWGFFLFTVGLTVTLFAIGYVGIMGPWGPTWTAGALGALIGARWSDALVSHVLLCAVGYRPNPGFSSALIYLLEGGFIAWVFKAALTADPYHAEIGFAGGVMAFVLVLPLLWLLRTAVPALRRVPWTRGQPMPAWASAHP